MAGDWCDLSTLHLWKQMAFLSVQPLSPLNHKFLLDEGVDSLLPCLHSSPLPWWMILQDSAGNDVVYRRFKGASLQEARSGRLQFLTLRGICGRHLAPGAPGNFSKQDSFPLLVAPKGKPANTCKVTNRVV